MDSKKTVRGDQNNNLEVVKRWIEQEANLHAAARGQVVVKYLLELGTNLMLRTTKHFDWLQKMAIWRWLNREPILIYFLRIFNRSSTSYDRSTLGES